MIISFDTYEKEKIPLWKFIPTLIFGVMTAFIASVLTVSDYRYNHFTHCTVILLFCIVFATVLSMGFIKECKKIDLNGYAWFYRDNMEIEIQGLNRRMRWYKKNYSIKYQDIDRIEFIKKEESFYIIAKFKMVRTEDDKRSELYQKFTSAEIVLPVPDKIKQKMLYELLIRFTKRDVQIIETRS